MKRNIRVILLTMVCILLCACSKEKETENETTTAFDMEAAQARDRKLLDEVYNNVLVCITDAEQEQMAITEGDILLTCTGNDDLTIKGSTGLETLLERILNPHPSSTISKVDARKTTIKVSIRGNVTSGWKAEISFE